MKIFIQTIFAAGGFCHCYTDTLNNDIVTCKIFNSLVFVTNEKLVLMFIETDCYLTLSQHHVVGHASQKSISQPLLLFCSGPRWLHHSISFHTILETNVPKLNCLFLAENQISHFSKGESSNLQILQKQCVESHDCLHKGHSFFFKVTIPLFHAFYLVMFDNPIPMMK